MIVVILQKPANQFKALIQNDKGAIKMDKSLESLSKRLRKIDEQLDQYYEERACCGSREERRDFPTFEDWKRDQENPNWPR